MKKLAFILVLLFSATVQAQPVNEKEVDDQRFSKAQKTLIEDLVINDINGKQISVEDLGHKMIVVLLWEPWCRACIQTMKVMDMLKKDFGNNLIVIAITPGNDSKVEKVRSFIEKNNYDFHYAMSENLARDMGVNAFPIKFVISPDGDYLTYFQGHNLPDGQDYKEVKKLLDEQVKLCR